MPLRPGDLIFKLLARGGGLGLCTGELVTEGLLLTLKVVELQLEVVFTLLKANFLRLAKVEGVGQTGDFLLGLGEVLLYLTGLEAEDVTTAQETI